jgi:hypothetical protein
VADNLRDQTSASSFYQDESGLLPEEFTLQKRFILPFLRIKPRQRFLLAVMLLIVVCLLGTMCLVITGKFGLY